MNDDIAVGKKVRLTQVIEGTVSYLHPEGGEMTIETEEFGSWTFELPFDSCQVLEVFREIQAGDVYRSTIFETTKAFVYWNSSDTLAAVTTHGRRMPIIEQFQRELDAKKWELVSSSE